MFRSSRTLPSHEYWHRIDSASSVIPNTAGSFSATATGFPAPTLSETGALPSGVTFNTATGVLSGTPAAGTGGTYPLTFTQGKPATPQACWSLVIAKKQQWTAPYGGGMECARPS